jgi:hypothetical protein
MQKPHNSTVVCGWIKKKATTLETENTRSIVVAPAPLQKQPADPACLVAASERRQEQQAETQDQYFERLKAGRGDEDEQSEEDSEPECAWEMRGGTSFSQLRFKITYEL